MYKAKFYHGLSSDEWKQVKKQRHFNLRKDTGRWLAMSGVYFFRGNPVLAYRWAARKENRLKPLPPDPMNPTPSSNSPIVLQVELNKPNTLLSLDLTTDRGMELLFWGHRLLRGILEGPISEVLKAMKSSSDTIYYNKFVKKYLETKLIIYGFSKTEVKQFINNFSKKFDISKNKNIEHILESLFSSVNQKGHKETFNFDCAVITLLVLKYNYKVVVAAIQEGQPLNVRFHEHVFRSMFTEGFKGVRVQDHIEICVTDHNLIRWPPIEVTINRDDYDSEYWNAATEVKGTHNRNR